MPEATEVIGLVHGILFIFYVLFLLEVRSDYNWDNRKTLLSFIAAFLPCGTFIADVKIFKGYHGK
jgi:integral membrane protein